MLSVNVNSKEVLQTLEGIEKRLKHQRPFFRHLVRPRLLDEFAAAYRAGRLQVRSGRLLESYISLTHEEHVSEIHDDRIVQGTRVPYAIFVERLLPVAGRVARNQRLIAEFAQQLGEYVVDGDTR